MVFKCLFYEFFQNNYPIANKTPEDSSQSGAGE